LSNATIIALLLCTTTGRAAAAQDLVLTNARLIDPRSRTIEQGALWIENGRIAHRL
jgi:adenine deaminase